MRRLRSDVLASSILRLAASVGAYAVVRHKGHEEAGVVYVCLLRGGDLLVETFDSDGRLAWRPRQRQAPQGAIDEIISRERQFDDDLWVIDIDGAFVADDLPGRVLNH